MDKVLITGAGSGLGRELAKAYASRGSHVILLGRSREKLEELEKEIKANDGSAEYELCDITDYQAVNELADSISRGHGSIDCLINNAGLGYFGELRSATENQITQMLDTNIKGTIFVTQALLPYIKKRILNIISTAGLKGKVNEAVYCASKFAVRGFTEALQKELEHSTIEVSAIYMGGMDTPFWNSSDHVKDKSRLRSPAAVAEKIISMDDGRSEIIIE